MEVIVQTGDQRVDLYRDLRAKPEIHRRTGLFLAEGHLCVERLLKSGLEIVSVFAQESFFNKSSISALLAERCNTECYSAQKSVMNAVVGFKLHQAALAIGKIPQAPDFANIQLPALAMDAMINAENVGAIVRSCRAFGIKSLLIDGRSASPYLRRSVRVSLGTIFELPVYRVNDLTLCLQKLQKQNAQVIAAEALPGASDLADVRFDASYVLVIGSENNGIRQSILDCADITVAIPIESNVGSINAAAAAAILLYAAKTQG